MKMELRPIAWGLFVVTAVLWGCSCPPGRLRPGPPYDGSAKWAVDLAQPRFAAFAADAQLRTIAGARIASDGRVFANAGSWAVAAFSESRQQKIEVTVSASGVVSESISAVPPAGIQVPLPAGWINSTDVFVHVRSLVPPFDEAPLVTFNMTDFGAELAGQATWGVNTPGGNVLVLYDGSIARRQ
jgi:hypothetical protein